MRVFYPLGLLIGLSLSFISCSTHRILTQVADTQRLPVSTECSTDSSYGIRVEVLDALGTGMPQTALIQRKKRIFVPALVFWYSSTDHDVRLGRSNLVPQVLDNLQCHLRSRLGAAQGAERIGRGRLVVWLDSVGTQLPVTYSRTEIYAVLLFIERADILFGPSPLTLMAHYRFIPEGGGRELSGSVSVEDFLEADSPDGFEGRTRLSTAYFDCYTRLLNQRLGSLAQKIIADVEQELVAQN